VRIHTVDRLGREHYKDIEYTEKMIQ
jgi:hypothetical protein